MKVCVQKVNLKAYQEQQLLVLWKAILAIQRNYTVTACHRDIATPTESYEAEEFINVWNCGDPVFLVFAWMCF